MFVDFFFFRPIIVWRQESIFLMLRDPLVTCQSWRFEEKSTAGLQINHFDSLRIWFSRVGGTRIERGVVYSLFINQNILSRIQDDNNN